MYAGGHVVELPGFLLGFASAVALFAIVFALELHPGGWTAFLLPALQALLELLIGAAVVGGLCTAAVFALPYPLVASLFAGDKAADVVVFACAGLALFVAARSWRRYTLARAQAAEALIRAAQADADSALREKELAQSQLLLLQAQVEPHFLWNTLAHVQFLIGKDPANAARMTANLIRYLQSVVPQMRERVSTLNSEFESVQAYLALMQIRMGARLTVNVRIPEGLEDVPLPPLILQTLVENAIKHGVEPKVGPVSVTVNGSREMSSNHQARLLLEVIDDGVGLLAAQATKGTGVGLRNVRERLRLLYGDDASLAITAAARGGVVARVSIPLQAGASS
jgi:LytS/YehU family sensor histidine kinase